MSKFSKEIKNEVLKDFCDEIKIDVICMRYGVSRATIYNWAKKEKKIKGTEILYIKSCTFYLVKITKRAQGYCIARTLIRMHYNRLFLIQAIGVVIGFEKLAPYIRVCFAIEVMAKDILLFLC